MADLNVSRYSLIVTTEDRTNPADLGVFLRAIPKVKVFETFPDPAAKNEPTLLYVYPDGQYEVGELFIAIERQTDRWFKWRTDAVTVEIQRPDGHTQVLAKDKE